MGAGLYKFHECRDLSLEEMDFIIFHHRKQGDAQLMALGKLLGTSFPAGEIRSWGNEKSNSGSVSYKDTDNVVMPLSLVLKPELREHLKKIVGNTLRIEGGYKPKEGEQVVSLGQVSTEDFRYWLKHRTLPEATLLELQEKG